MTSVIRLAIEQLAYQEFQGYYKKFILNALNIKFSSIVRGKIKSFLLYIIKISANVSGVFCIGYKITC